MSQCVLILWLNINDYVLVFKQCISDCALVFELNTIQGLYSGIIVLQL